jgi:DNA-directed RNA polymerase alpha subunit
MTLRNIEIMDIIVNKMVEGKTLADALSDVYTKRRVAIPYNDDMLAISVRNLHMSSRTTNALMRAHLVTLGEVVRLCNQQKITDVKAMGTSGGTELFESVLNYLWEEMTEDEKMSFLIDVVERNESYIRPEIM